MLVYRSLNHRRQRYAAHLGTLGLVRDGGGVSVLGVRRHIPATVFLLGMALLFVATARPQMTILLPEMEGIVMLVFDVSASMAADDLEPTRMDAAKTAAHVFVERQPSHIKIGVVAFSEGGLLVQRPTDDKHAVDAAIDRLVPQSGTSLAHGIQAALHAITDVPSPGPSMSGSVQLTDAPQRRAAFKAAIIVAVTDGENTSEVDPLEAAQEAIEQGVRIYTVGVGSPTGATLEIDGFSVFTQLNESALQEIALLTEGEYFTAANTEELRAIYEKLNARFALKPQEMEVTSIIGGVSALVLLVGGGLSLFWFGRIP